MSKTHDLFIEVNLSKKPVKSTSRLASERPQFVKKRKPRTNIPSVETYCLLCPMEILVIV